jgi:hypothetical protein
MLSQLSYTPGKFEERRVKCEIFELHPSLFKLHPVGVPELESGTSSLSATRSNQLSYTPVDQSRISMRNTRQSWKRESLRELAFVSKGCSRIGRQPASPSLLLGHLSPFAGQKNA